jgi:heme/copper-type cytochrome/quinol oxidase subunit 4
MLTRMRQFLAAPVFEDEEKTRAAGLLNTILLILAAVTLVIIPFLAVIDPATAMFNLAIGAVMVVIVLGLACFSHLENRIREPRRPVCGQTVAAGWLESALTIPKTMSERRYGCDRPPLAVLGQSNPFPA